MGKTWDYRALYQLSRALHNQKLDKSKQLNKTLTTLGDIFDVTQGCVVTFNDDDSIDRAYVLDVSRKIPNEFWNTMLMQGVIGFVYHSRRTVNIRNIDTDPRWMLTGRIPETGSAIGVPLRNDFNVFGAILLMHPAVDYFDDNAVSMLEEIASLVSTAISNSAEYDAAQTGDTRYEHLFNGTAIPIVLTTLDGNILDANPYTCDFLEYKREDLLGLPITTIHGISESISEDGRFHDLPVNEERTFNATAFKHDRNEIPVSIRARRIRLRGRDVVEWVLQDATDHMQLEQLRGDLSAMIYHDLRGPLHSINGSINRLGKVLANHENPAVLTLLQIAIQSTRQLRRLVDSLLDIRRLEDGKAILDRQPMELRVLLADAAQLVQQIAFEAGQKIRFELENDLPLVVIDGDMMVRVVINLLENATKYTPEGGVIMLGATIDHEARFARVFIRDSGPGIPYNMQHQIFDKFNRVKYHNAPPGIGLGLAFCRLAVEAHGGTIWVESEPGNGAEFIFTLPLDVKPEATDTSEMVRV